MESRLPQFQFKVPARTVTGAPTINSLKANLVTNGDSSNTKSAPTSINTFKANIISNGIDSNSKMLRSTTKTMSSLATNSKMPDENKAPTTRSNALTTLSRSGISTTRAAQKRPNVAANAVDSKRANLKVTMKPTGIRPVRPATTIGPISVSRANSKPVTNAVKNSAAVPKPAGPKPSKWDLKGRLEYTNNELVALKQKYKDITTLYNNSQEEIESLRESESTNRLKAERMDATFKENEELKSENDKLKRERDTLAKDLSESQDLYQKATVTLEQNMNDIKMKDTLITELTEENNTLKTKTKDLSALVMDLDRDRRALHNTIQEMKGNIRVFCRVRPKILKESSKSVCPINYLDECTLEIGKIEDSNSTKAKQRNEFTFDRVFPPNTSQEDVFKELSMLVQSALEGYNVCVFAYGQTGSGKTYTMEGFPTTENEGMIPRTVKHIFEEMKHFELLGWEYKIEASFLEIYNEQIIDLLDYQRKTHEIRMADSKGTDLYVTNLLVQEINSPQELNHCLLMAQENRAMAATQSNERSSRSHSVARIRLIGTHKEKQEVTIGNLNLVDLAGSERLKNEEAVRIAETKNINKSLANLGHVILALLQKQDHIPYRNSKLTHLLMPSLGGNSKTLMLLNISPLDDAYNESLNSLRFGSNVNSCKTGTVKKVKTIL